jgi:hypothetical protein
MKATWYEVEVLNKKKGNPIWEAYSSHSSLAEAKKSAIRGSKMHGKRFKVNKIAVSGIYNEGKAIKL